MKKFTLFGVALCASAMVLAGCSKNGDNTGSGEAPSTEPVVNPSITSVTVSPSSASLAPGQKLQASVVVVAVGGAAETVTWSSSDSAKAEVSASGLITAKALGEVTITATSTFDSSKSASVALNVIDKGWSPDLYDEGYTYLEDHSDWPVDDIREFIGTGEYSVAKPDDSVLDEGFYVKETPESTEDYNTYEAVFKGDFGDDVVAQLVSAGGKMYMYEGYFSSWPCVIDASKLFEYDITGYNLSEVYEEGADIDVTSIELYHVSDLFDNAAKTTATDWSAEEKAMFSSAYLPALPFVAFGEDYTFEVDEEEGYVHIYDYNVNWEYLDGYGTLLEAAGFSYDTNEDAYYKALPGDNGYISYKVQFGFGGNGNELFYGVDLTPFYEPTTPFAKLDEFVADEIGSKYSFPLAESMFTKGSAWYYMPSSDGSAFQLMIEGVKKADFDGYKAIFDKFVEDNAVIEHAYVVDESYLERGYLFVEGYLGATAIMFQYDIEGETLIAQFSSSGKHENPGLYPSADAFAFDNAQADAIDLKAEIEVFALDPIGEFTPTWTFELKDAASSEALSITDAGVVTPKAPGEGIVVVTYKYGESDENEETIEVPFVVNNFTVINFTAADAAATDTEYKEFSKSFGEGAVVVSGVTAKDSNDNIQFNNKEVRKDGIVINTAPTTIIQRVEVEFVSASNPVNFYGAKSAITSADLYEIAEPDMQFTVSATNKVAVLPIEGQFYHLGVLSSKSMVLVKEIKIVYSSYTPDTANAYYADPTSGFKAVGASWGIELTEAAEKYLYGIYNGSFGFELYSLNAEGSQQMLASLIASAQASGYTIKGQQGSYYLAYQFSQNDFYNTYIISVTYYFDVPYANEIDVKFNDPVARWPELLPEPSNEVATLIGVNYVVNEGAVTFAVESTALFNQIKDAYIETLVADGFELIGGSYVKTNEYGTTSVSFDVKNVSETEEPSYVGEISWVFEEPEWPEDVPAFAGEGYSSHEYLEYTNRFVASFTYPYSSAGSTAINNEANAYMTALDNAGFVYDSETGNFIKEIGYEKFVVSVDDETNPGVSFVLTIEINIGDIAIPSFLPQGTEESIKDYLTTVDVKATAEGYVVEYGLENAEDFNGFKTAYIALLTSNGFAETASESGIYEKTLSEKLKVQVTIATGDDADLACVNVVFIPINA